MSPCGQFLGQLHFRQNTSSQQQLLAQTNQLVTTVTFSRQLFLQSSQFFIFQAKHFFTVAAAGPNKLARYKSYFFEVVISSEQLVFLYHLLLQNTHFFAAVTFFRLVTYSERNVNQEILLLENQVVSYRAVSFSEQLLFLKTNLFRTEISTEQLLFSGTCFYKASIFSEKLLFH